MGQRVQQAVQTHNRLPLIVLGEYLVSKNVDRERLTAIGYGSERPAVASDDGPAINRRVEFSVSDE